MAANFIPSTLAAFVPWVSNFCSLITAAPPTYGLVAGDAANLNAAQATFVAAYAISNSKSTRTSAAVAATQAARNVLTQLVRGYANDHFGQRRRG